MDAYFKGEDYDLINPQNGEIAERKNACEVFKLIVDGAEIPLPGGEPYVDADAEELGLYQFDVVNTYHKEAYTSPSILATNNSIEIQFTVSGFNVDDPDAVIAEPTEAPTEEPASSDAGSAASSGADDKSDSDEEGSSNTTTIIIVVVAAIVVIGGVVLVMRKKK